MEILLSNILVILVSCDNSTQNPRLPEFQYWRRQVEGRMISERKRNLEMGIKNVSIETQGNQSEVEENKLIRKVI